MRPFSEWGGVSLAESWAGKVIDTLRAIGARGLTNAGLRLVGLLKRDQPAAQAPADLPGPLEPAGPFVQGAAVDAPALLFFVPRRLRSRLIDGATGGYGYSHVAVDCGEIDQPTGKRVMIESVPGRVVHRSFQDEYGARPFARAPLAWFALPAPGGAAAASDARRMDGAAGPGDRGTQAGPDGSEGGDGGEPARGDGQVAARGPGPMAGGGQGTSEAPAPAGSPAAAAGIDLAAFCQALLSKLGQPYDNLEALTWGEVDDPAKQICSNLVTVCLPRPVLEDMARRQALGRLPRRSMSVRNSSTPEFRAFVSPNALAAYFGAPPGERLRRPDVLVRRPPASPARGKRLNVLLHAGRLSGINVGPSRGRLRGGMPAMLIYNPAAGVAGLAGSQLMLILAEMQRCGIQAEVHVVTPESRLEAVSADAVRRGIRLVVVAGGDGTIDSAMGGLVGTHGTLGIIPTGTRNNVALSLGIPQANIPAAVDLLRTGRPRRIDVGRAYCNGAARWFLEAGAVGLVSTLYPAADELQHGDLGRVGELVAAFVSAAPGQIHLRLDHGQEIRVDQGHMLVVANMPYVGAHFHLASSIACDDGLLDVLIYDHLSKLDLLTYAVQLSSGAADDPRVAHYQARRVEVWATPPMPVMVDGVSLGECPLRASLHRRALAVMAGEP